MWKMKTIIPVVAGELGVIKKGLEKLLREISGNINLWEIEKTTDCWERHIFYGRSYPSKKS